MSVPRVSLVLLTVASTVALGGCSSDVNPIKAAFVDAGYGPRAVKAPDFVETSRRADIGYMPVGEDAARRPVRARSAEGQRALAAELEGARTRNEARGRAAEGAGKNAGKDVSAGKDPAAAR